mmetsp:Transcript_11981/g.22900  ORF Transcript_11981/g.22900 Transcript_11981/m.22900 type:complete len:549 (+) Transcript_11981:166-1812(+)
MRQEKPEPHLETEGSGPPSAGKVKRKRWSRSSSHPEDSINAEPVPEREDISNRSLSKSKKEGRSSRRSDDGGSNHAASGDRENFSANTSHLRDTLSNRRGEDSSSKRSMLEQLEAEVEASSENNQGGKAGWMRKSRLIAGKIVEDPWVQLLIIFLIIVNAVIMGVSTFDFVTDDPSVDRAFEKTDRAFLIVFTLELVLQLHYRRSTFFSDSWLIFDFVIVVASWSLESLQVVRAFRIFRALRLVTRIGPLRELVMAIGAVMPRMYAIAMLLFLIFYIFAVLFTELFSEMELEDNLFVSLDVSLFTCMEMMTLEWSDTTREIMKQEPYAWAPLVAFVAVTGFIVFNLIVAVVCDAVAVIDREAEAEKYPELLTDKQNIQEAQERIWELTETVEILMMRQERLLSVADMLAKEVRAAVASPQAIGAHVNLMPVLKSAMKPPSSARRNNSSHGNNNDGSNPPRSILQFSDDGAEKKPTFQDDEENKIESRPGNDEDQSRFKAAHNSEGGVEVELQPSVGEDDLEKLDNSSYELGKDVQSAVDRITLGRTGR